MFPWGAACSGDRDGPLRRSATVRDSAGIELVDGPVDDAPLHWSIEKIFSIGGAEAGAESFVRLERRLVDIGPAGNLFVLDAGNHRVAVFDSTGKFMLEMGSRGGGPGELLRPQAVSVDSFGRIWILDLGKQAFVRFTLDGQRLKERPLDVLVTGGAIALTSWGLLTTLIHGYRTASDSVATRLVLIGSHGDTTILESLRQQRPEMTEYGGCANFPLLPLFTPHLTWSHNADRIVVSAQADYQISYLRKDTLVRLLRRAVPPKSTSQEMAFAVLGDGKTIRTPYGSCRVSPEEELRKRGMEEYLPAITGLALSPDGSLWVRRGAVPVDSSTVDVFGPDGTYSGTLRPGSPFPVGFISPEKVVALEQDALGIDYLIAYQIKRN